MFQKINLGLLRVPQLNVSFAVLNTLLFIVTRPFAEAKVSLADQEGWCTKCLSGKHLLDK